MNFSNLTSLQTLEKLYQEYQENPESLDPHWRSFFSGVDFAEKELKEEEASPLKIYMLVRAYRKYGHLLMHVNPIDSRSSEIPPSLRLSNLGFEDSDLQKIFPTLSLLEKKEATLLEIIKALQNIYCSRIGIEYMHCENLELRQWIQEQIEPNLSIELTAYEKKDIMEHLNRIELFESFLHMKYVGQTRFSLEGVETLIPVLAFLVEKGGDTGVSEFIFAMAHRGRLNVLASIFRRSYSVIFHEFEAHYFPLMMEGSSDVKYHKGFSSNYVTAKGNQVHLHLTANPSHLESVDPVAIGQVRAKQVLKNDEKKKKIVPILIHGDASIAGQGVVYEIMGMMNVDGYSVGGTLHIVVNNQIGFTTLPQESRSTRYCTDIGKAFDCPIIHVNAEDPESCIWAAILCLKIRQQFGIDVFLDLNGYRKYGHNEGDEPFFTQPLQYKMIRAKKTIREIYHDELISQGIVEREMAAYLEKEFKEELHIEMEIMKTYFQKPPEPEKIFGTAWSEFLQGEIEDLYQTIDTKVSEKKLKELYQKASVIPKNFHLHKKLIKWLEDRNKKFDEDPGKPVFDWAFCEFLAFASILEQNIHVRLSGQDSRRGTYNQRHAVWIDQENAQKYFPLDHLGDNQGRFDVLNSPLCEFAAMGFEYGYSLSYPNALVLWEGQYGDFVNGAQIIIDQFLTTGEMKWNRYSSLVLLLPHAYEGQGPEHSSARIERFLQLSGHENIQVAYPSTPAQLFHLLRRQAIRKLKKPLIVFTPKSLLRLPSCVSSLKDMTEGEFFEILDDSLEIKKIKKVLFCSGKIFYDLLAKRDEQKREDIAIVRIEQLYPIHEEKLKKIFSKYKNISKWHWIQEEPENMGAWDYIRPILSFYLSKSPLYIGRERSASPSTGSHAVHKKEQKQILEEAFQ